MTGSVLASANEVENLVQRILDESPIGMSVAARLLGTFRGGKPTHPSTPTRWHLYGWKRPNGSVLKLEAVRLNGRLVTSKQALVRFVAAQQLLPADGVACHTIRPPAARQKASEAAANRLKELGC